MAFRVLFLAHAPDADPEKHRCVIETGKYKLYSLVVRNQSQAVEECKKLVAEEGIHSIILCPGFAHRSVAEIVEAVGGNVVVSVAMMPVEERQLSTEPGDGAWRSLSVTFVRDSVTESITNSSAKKI